MKLYRLKLRGTNSSYSTQYFTPYVLAENAEMAHQKVKEYLEINKIGSPEERELESIKLLAEDTLYPRCQVQLY